MIFPYSTAPHMGIFLTVMAWSVTEVVRFIFYSLKLVEMGSPQNMFAYVMSKLRYTLFIVLYPIGVSGELICCYKTWEYLQTLPEDERPFTITLPNTWNFGFNYSGFIMIGVPIIYALSFPGLYMHMWTQRKKFNKEVDEMFSKASLKVPGNFKKIMPIPGMRRFTQKPGSELNGAQSEIINSLEHKKGEVWLIDFWATWCPPCQGPMAHNQHMWHTCGDLWKDLGVRIICISIDNDKSKLVSHVNSK